MCYITILDMFRALTCPSVEGHCIITASVIITLCKRLYSMQVESSVLSTGILCNPLERAMIKDAVIIQFVLLKMGMLMFVTCRGL